MPTVSLDGARLKDRIRIHAGSVNQLIAQSNGLLTQKNRSAVHRGCNGHPIDQRLAEAIAQALQTSVAALQPGYELMLQLTPENHLLNQALRLVRQWPIHERDSDSYQSSDPCVAIWLREQLEMDDSTFERILEELVRIGHLRLSDHRKWLRVAPTIQELTRMLKRRVAFQWPIIRDVFAMDATSRKRTGRLIRELIELAETKVHEPMTFFCIDDQIHEALCRHAGEMDLVRVSRATSWGIAYDIIFDLDSQMRVDPYGAVLSMKAITGWMLEDYRNWAGRLMRTDVGDLARVQTDFRRHVLRMRDYAQYYRSLAKTETYGQGNSCPGSESV